MPDTRIPSIDETIERNDKQASQRLQQGYKQAKGLIDRQIAQGRQAIENQYKFKHADMKRKYQAAVRAGDIKGAQRLTDQIQSFRSQAMAKIQALNDKHAPENQELHARMQAEVQKLTQQAQMRNTRLQAIRDAVSAKIITDPAVAQQAEYNAAYGVIIPLSRFKAQSPSPEQKKAQLKRDIQSINNRLEQFTPGQTGSWLNIIPGGKPFEDVKPVIVDPFTGEKRKLDSKNPEDAQIIEDMHGLNTAREGMIKEYQDILITENPAIAKEIKDTQRWKDAEKISANGGRLNIEGSIRKTIGEQNKGKLIMMRAPDGEVGGIPQKNVASALAQGFKRVQ
jgi:protein-tyrosine-phosphatase